MKRRDFLRVFGLGAATLPFVDSLTKAQDEMFPKTQELKELHSVEGRVVHYDSRTGSASGATW